MIDIMHHIQRILENFEFRILFSGLCDGKLMVGKVQWFYIAAYGKNCMKILTVLGSRSFKRGGASPKVSTFSDTPSPSPPPPHPGSSPV